jgi:hypothetical protein
MTILIMTVSSTHPVYAAPPSNDNLAGAAMIATLPYTDSVDATEATLEPDEPQSCAFSSQTVWYSFTAGATGVVRADIQSSTNIANLTVYQAVGSGFGGLNALTCGVSGNSISFDVEAGMNYYLQAGLIGGGPGTLTLDLQEIPPPANDDFASAESVGTALPLNLPADSSGASLETGEPTPSCATDSFGNTVWYAFTPTTSGSFTANALSASFSAILAAYTGSSLQALSELGCSTPGEFLLTFQAQAGTTYYIQIGGFFNDGSPFQFSFDTAAPPQVDMCFGPPEPSTLDDVQFNDCSFDPARVNFESFTWDFGDGGIATEQSPAHQYTEDGDYTVQHSATTFDGRTGSVSRVVQVRTHDVSIWRFSTPKSARVGETKKITVSLVNDRYPETVRIDLYRSIAGGGFELISSSTQIVPVKPASHTTQFSFNYTFSSQDARIGKVTFRAFVAIETMNDAFPADNQAFSVPPTFVKP